MTIQIVIDSFDAITTRDTYTSVYEIDGRFHGKFTTVDNKIILDSGYRNGDEVSVERRVIIKR